jgi:hypothetical protein
MSLAYSVQGKLVRTTTPTLAQMDWSSLPTPYLTKPLARKWSVWKWCRAAAAQLADSPTSIAHAPTSPESSGPTRCAIHPAGASLYHLASPRTSGRRACRSFGLRTAAGYSCHFTVSRTFCAIGRNSSNLRSCVCVATLMSTVSPLTSTMMYRSFRSAPSV